MQAAHYHIRGLFVASVECVLCRTCVSTTTEDAKTVATAIVSSRLDYCNSVSYGTLQTNLSFSVSKTPSLIGPIQSYQLHRCQHISPVLAELHWLLVAARIEFKVALTTFKVLTTQRPSYLHELLTLHRPSRWLKSDDHNYWLRRDQELYSRFRAAEFCVCCTTCLEQCFLSYHWRS